jgi:hypothetical protein
MKMLFSWLMAGVAIAGLAVSSAAAMSVKEYFDAEANAKIRHKRAPVAASYLRAALEAYAYANAETQRLGRPHLYCDPPDAPPQVDNIEAMLRADAAEMKQGMDPSEFEVMIRTTDLTRFLLLSLQKNYPCR